MSQATRAVSDWQDPFGPDGQLREGERMVVQGTRQFAVGAPALGEGTQDVHALILGRGITGTAAFAD